MREGFRVTALSILAMVMLAGPAWSPPAEAAAGDCFLRLDGVPGDSADARHRGEIDVVGWSLGVASGGAAAMGAAGGTGRADFQPLKVTQLVGRGVPSLVQIVAAWQLVPSAILACRRPGRDTGDYFKVTLADVLVSGVRLTDAADTQPSVEITLAYGRITIEYRPQGPDGSLGPPVVTGWDVRTNRRL